MVIEETVINVWLDDTITDADPLIPPPELKHARFLDAIAEMNTLFDAQNLGIS